MSMSRAQRKLLRGNTPTTCFVLGVFGASSTLGGAGSGQGGTLQLGSFATGRAAVPEQQVGDGGGLDELRPRPETSNQPSEGPWF